MYHLIVLEVKSLTWVPRAKIEVLAGLCSSGVSKGESISLFFELLRVYCHSLASGPFS